MRGKIRALHCALESTFDLDGSRLRRRTRGQTSEQTRLCRERSDLDTTRSKSRVINEESGKTHWQTVYADELLPTAPPLPPEIERVVPPTPSEYVSSRADQCKRQQWHTTRKERYEKVQELKAEGLNIAQVARYLGVSYSGIRLLYEASEYLVVQRQASGSGVEPYDACLRERWAALCHNAQQLHRELMTQGYMGSRVIVSRYVYPWRQTDGIIVNGALISPSSLKPPKRKIPTARERLDFIES